jgi:hypothetical protein
LEMPRMKAQFCLHRALEAYNASRWSSGADISMLVVAGLGGGLGTSIGAAASAMDDTDKSRKDVGIVSVTTLAAAGAVLGLRAALNLSEVGRAQRIAAARNVATAISVLEKFALADDPKDVADDAFSSCRDEDINIANAFPGPSGAEPLEKILSKAKEEKAETVKATSEAKTAEAQAKSAARENQAKVAELEKTVRTLHDASRTPEKDARVQQAEEDLKKARAAQAELKEKEKEAKKQAELESARAEVASAKVDVSEGKVAVAKAGARLRRAMFYLTSREVDLELDLLQRSVSSLDTSQLSLAAAQKRLHELLDPPAATAK